jgi:hypothetical protein
MATFAYALRTNQRKGADSATSTTTEPPANATWVDAVAALVPAEVLAIHAFAISKLTSTAEVGRDGNVVATVTGQPEHQLPDAGDAKTVVTTTTDTTALKWTFWALVALAAGIYVFRAWSKFNSWDLLRLLIPPSAFVLWTMLTPGSAFDAAFPGDLTEARRELIAVIGAVVLGYFAKKLGDQANSAPKR